MATKAFCVMFHDLLSKKIAHKAMGLPLEPSYSNAYLSYYERNCSNSLQRFEAVIDRNYVDDIFILCKLNDHSKYFS